MQENTGAVAPNDGAQPDGELPEGAIDSTLEAVEKEIVDTRAIKAEQEANELRQRLAAQQERINELVKTSTTQSEMLSELVGGMRDAKDRGWAYEAERLRGVMRKAASEADQTTYDAAEQALFNHMEHRPVADGKRTPKRTEAEPVDDKTKQQTPPDPAVVAWFGQNAWTRDKNMFREARAIEENLLEDKPYLTTVDRLEEVKKEMARRHPEKFGNQARNQPPAVSRPGPQTAKPKAKAAKTEADLSPEDRAVMDRLVRSKVLTKEQYLKDYQWDK